MEEEESLVFLSSGDDDIAHSITTAHNEIDAETIKNLIGTAEYRLPPRGRNNRETGLS